MKEWFCPFHHRGVDGDECQEMHLIAMWFFEDESLAREAERDKLAAVCEKCGKHGAGA